MQGKIDPETTSVWYETTRGYPQGSFFGPLLWNVFQNDLHYRVKNWTLFMCAGDHQWNCHMLLKQLKRQNKFWMKKGTKCPSGMTKMFERWFLQLSDHKLWPKIKEQGIESQNAEYWGSTKTGAKAARHFCGWTIKIYDLHKQHLQERCKSCRHDIEITEINTYISKLQIVKSAVLPHLTANWCKMPES